MNRLISLTIMAFLSMAAVADASSWCVNDSYRTSTANITINGASIVITEPPDYCNYGCAGGECVPSSNGMTPIAMAILFSMAAFILIYLGLNLREDYAVMSWLFIPLSIVLLAGGVFYVSNMSVFESDMMNSLAWIFYILIVVAIIIIFIFLLKLLTKLLGGIFPYSNGHYDDKTREKRGEN